MTTSAIESTMMTVSRIVSVSLAPACEYIDLTCNVCMGAIEVDQTVVLDWQANILLHSICVPLYIEQFIRSHPGLTIAGLMAMFGASRRTVTRRRQGVRRNGDG